MIAGTNRRFIPVVADTRDFSALEAAVTRAEKELGPVEILVADAGIQIFTPLAKSTQRQWQDVIDVNLTGTANTIRAVSPHMIKRKKGSIIAIASGQGRHGMKNGAAYSASKWGIIGLVKSVALELGEYHIRVNTIEPGLVDTVMTRNRDRWNEALKLAGKEPQESPKEEDVVKAQLLHATMKIPWLQAEDIAPAAVFLASDASRWVSGATYDVTGGDSANYTA
jgi:NAD(P)-dependent dehydrogenase (short-subunit alcohol dehydrogenase family)